MSCVFIIYDTSNIVTDHSVLKEKSKVSDPIYEEVQAREITNISTNQSYGKMEQIEMISNECYSTVFNHEL